MMLTRFFVLMRGALTPPPRMEEPVVNMPQPAPMTDREREAAIPIPAHMCGDVSVRNHAMSNLSPCPVSM